MRYLLDTHALLFWLFDERRLRASARAVVADPSNTILVSSATAWEIATKHRLGRLLDAGTLLTDLPGWIARAGFLELPIRLAHAERAGSWRQEHRDPTDRMLAAQSALESATLVANDPAFRAFGIPPHW